MNAPSAREILFSIVASTLETVLYIDPMCPGQCAQAKEYMKLPTIFENK